MRQAALHRLAGVHMGVGLRAGGWVQPLNYHRVLGRRLGSRMGAPRCTERR
jgi:hypothetical protein